MLQKLFGRKPAPDQAVDEESAIDKQVKRLAKEIYKTNTLAESQLDQTRQAVELMKAALGELQNVQKDNQETRLANRVEVARALFPVIDGVEAGISSGSTLLNNLTDVPVEVIDALKGWLDGQRLILGRLDSILQEEGIRRIVATGKAFDPRYHVAVKSGNDPQQPVGIILKEERRGYLRGESVLRYAEVIVNQNGGRG